MNSIKIIKGSRYKGFEYQIQTWDDLDKLQNRSATVVGNILKAITEHSTPLVAHSDNGLPNQQSIDKKK